MPERGRATERDSRSRSPSKKGKKGKKDKKSDREKRKASDTDSSGEASHGTGSAAPLAVALRTDNSVLTVDFVNSLAGSINALTRSVQDIHLGMQVMQKESKEQRGQISAILGELHGLNTKIEATNSKYQSDMDTLNKEIEQKLAMLKAGPGLPSRPASSAAAASSAASSGPPVPVASLGGPPSGGHRPTRIWIKGFKETLTTKFLNDFARKAVDRLPPELRAGARTGAPGFGPAVYIDYPITTKVAPIKDALNSLKLTHTDEKGEMHTLRISSDLPLAVRHKGRVLGELWKLVEPYLDGLPAAVKPKDFKLGNSNGKLFLVLEHRPVELFATSVDDSGTLHITPNLANLNKYQINEGLAQSWASSASRSAARSGH
jgi:hypothetical protein